LGAGLDAAQLEVLRSALPLMAQSLASHYDVGTRSRSVR
jgi:hypothetical protein